MEGRRRQFCTFAMGEDLYGIDLELVQEVMRTPSVTRVPRSPPVVRGLMNLRGKIVLVIDLGLRLGLPPDGRPARSMNVVLRQQGGSTAVRVDRICEVVDVAEDEFEAPPATLRPPMRSFIRGTYKLDSKLLLVLMPEHLTGDKGSLPGSSGGVSA